MRRSLFSSSLVRDCTSQSRRARLHHVSRQLNRAYSSSDEANRGRSNGSVPEQEEEGAMSRRLSEMSEHNLETGGRSARKAVEEAGFSEELKARLEEKIASATFKSENAAAFAQVNLPASAGKGTADIATARPWTGTESVEDATLRMLDDAHKPLRIRRPPKLPAIRGPPKTIDTGRPASKATGTRLANARDKTSVYSYLKDSNLTDEEREKYRKELKERFAPTARAIPATIQGLQSLANERIEDAIARGQFKNIPRGKTIERDYNASNPFLDTTEYFMNKLIQKQEIVPPWIEKQQELAATAARFRAQLRGNWRRHVARTIASRGGSLSDQMRLAEEYAFAEREDTIRGKGGAMLAQASTVGHVSQISPSGELQSDNETSSGAAVQPELDRQDQDQPTATRVPSVRPFRDPQWEANERSYHIVAVQNLNNLARSYNLMAPDLAKKPYFSLERELKSCFAHVAPQVAEAIRERALAPPVKGIEVIGHKPGGVMNKFSMDRAAHVYDEQRPQYGFKEFWRDLFTKS